MSDKIATLVQPNLPEYYGTASLYRLDPPLEGSEYVVVSALASAPSYDPKAPGGVAIVGETLILPASPLGERLNGPELAGSQRGTTDHAVALLSAGYEVTA